MASAVDDVSRLSGEFLDNRLEVAYRSTQRQAEFAQIRLIWLLALLFFCAYGAIDVLLLSSGLDLFTLRLAILCCGGLAITVGATVRSHQLRDRVNFLALLLVSVCYVQLLQRRELPGNPQGAILLLVVGMYMFSPGRFSWVCVNGISCSLLYWHSLGAEFGRAGGWVSLSYLVPANLLAALALARLNRARRLSYAHQQQLRLAHRQSRQLLYNALPRVTAQYLQKHPGQLPAQHIDSATVVFADIVGFTALSRQLSAADLVIFLNHLFSSFDSVLEQFGLEKIKTLGDAYMAVAGAPTRLPDHAERALAFALAQQRYGWEVGSALGIPLQLRIGLNSGPLVAGVIGRKRYAFDVWGETVNIASRLQAMSDPDQILVAASTSGACGNGFQFGPERILTLKGGGSVSACYLESLQPIKSPQPMGSLQRIKNPQPIKSLQLSRSSQLAISSAQASTEVCTAGDTV